MSTEFIKLISDLHEERFNLHLASLAKNRTPCGIFFAFQLTPTDAAENLRQLQKISLNVTCAVVVAEMQVDALKNLVDVPVITLDDLESFPAKPCEVFITDELRDFAFMPYFERYGIDTLILSNGNYFAFMMKFLPELYRVHEMLGSDESKKVFRAVIKGLLTGKLNDYRFAPEPQYFLEGFTPCAGDIAIDGGAFDGATALAFANCGAKVFAFEMDAANYQKCLSNINRHGNLDITLENLGLSDRAGVEHYFAYDIGSLKDSGGALTANFTDLDSYVARKNLPCVDYIKLDIEGAELDMLHGAARTIERFKPKMAVSAYHKHEDLWTLALYIKSLRPDYEFEFRHYQIDATNYILNDGERAVLKYFGLKPLLPTIYEFVLYCR